jgi:hypothetical protein
MITTIADYAKNRGVTRQFIYEYVQKGKFRHFELPIFIELDGKRIEVGSKKFLEVPDDFAPKKTDVKPIQIDGVYDSGLDNLVIRLSDDPYIQDMYREYLTLPASLDRKSVKTQMYEKIDNHPERERLYKAIDEANIRLMQYMVQMRHHIKDVLKENTKEKMTAI